MKQVETTYTLHKNTFSTWHAIPPNRKVKNFRIKTFWDGKKIVIFEKGSILHREDQIFFWENEKFIITALTRELQKKLF